ncbi:MAG TPA: hydroxylamine reductase, partial [Bacteroidales bacterium]|nr:hydroxylamine reductase [Bacteroidales bacterium]
MSMFCFQCQETAKGTGCTVSGVCGKKDDLARRMDVLIYLCKGISTLSLELNNKGITTPEVNPFILNSLFQTITNANFDKAAITKSIYHGLELKRKLLKLANENGVDINKLPEAATWDANTEEEIQAKETEVGVLTTKDEDIRSLRELVVYGVKGMAAYAEHAHNLGFVDEDIYNFMKKALASTLDNSLSINDLINLVLQTGEYGVKTMALLDKANTTKYGNPE